MCDKQEASWWVYILLCEDGSFYTGIARNVAKRFAAHQKGRGARYTRAHRPVKVWCQFGPYSHTLALQEERRLKKLSHHAKEALQAIG
ncbi:MAG: GIY-YIG nuclease family protein [Sulfobacillus thermosulfidooxidans]|uniref:GIY-YIG domain-containing protein n=1 Tax=Sulfobacillus thermotolerans TaxID=338644 RepID=A0ABN5GWT3_9FIRM|nr:GIY-YIG nuclease family protein [Sulfobacillus sp. hq2]AUW92779.1 hypothetical protein BXT84_01425 [Sulfobacillus thermotolerans]POB09929.1 hypothetical protein CO251_11945 [Sulfobacillus sp. hq2]PSR36640.1 MAG: GIY-YIG nuclease family protein [Sulfobacillus thermosulfidooxidans]